MLLVTLNTNKAASTAAQERFYKDRLARFIRVELGSVESWRTLIRIEPSFDAIDHIDVSAIGVERGPKYHRIHAHFVVTIQHHGKVNFRYTQKRWQTLVNERLGFGTGTYAEVELLDARRLNYAVKTSGGKLRPVGGGIQGAGKYVEF